MRVAAVLELAVVRVCARYHQWCRFRRSRGLWLRLELVLPPPCDGAVVGRRGRERTRCETAPELEGGAARVVVLGHFGHELLVLGGRGGNGDVSMVLGRGAKHRGAADIDVLDAGAKVRPFRYRSFKGIPVVWKRRSGKQEALLGSKKEAQLQTIFRKVRKMKGAR